MYIHHENVKVRQKKIRFDVKKRHNKSSFYKVPHISQKKIAPNISSLKLKNNNAFCTILNNKKIVKN